MDTHPLHVSPRTPIVDVVREMASLRKGYCLVLEKHKPVGIITPRDVIKLLIEFKPSIHMPLYVFGFQNEDEAEMESAKRKIERVAVRGLRMHPSLQEIVVHGKTIRVTGNRKRYKVRARAYTPTTRLAFTAKGWSLRSVFDELAEKMDKRLRQTKTKTHRSRRKFSPPNPHV